MRRGVQMTSRRTIVSIVGWRKQVNHKPDRTCQDGCQAPIAVGQEYIRVMRDENVVEFFDIPCFEDEFGIDLQEGFGDESGQ